MNPFLAHIGGGGSFYSGLLLMMAGMMAELFSADESGWRTIGRILIVSGVAGVGLSSVPQPWWLLSLWLIGFLLWRVTYNSDWMSRRVPPNVARLLFLLLTIVLLAAELPYRQNPPALAERPSSMLVVGDSLTAGTYRLSESRRWPAVFERRYHPTVNLVAQPGWTVGQALDRLRGESIPDSVDVILLLIGGNDVMLGTPTDTFRRDLDGLLERVTQAEVPVYMMEIPLPPFGYQYGRIQRRLVREHGIRLIPKHHLMTVMSGSKRTLDGIHLSARGHRIMARMINRVMLPSPVQK